MRLSCFKLNTELWERQRTVPRQEENPVPRATGALARERFGT